MHLLMTNVTQDIRVFFHWVENVVGTAENAGKAVGKGELARYKQFLLFQQCFQKVCTADMLKPGLV